MKLNNIGHDIEMNKAELKSKQKQTALVWLIIN